MEDEPMFNDEDCIMFDQHDAPDAPIKLVGEIWDRDTVEFNFVIVNEKVEKPSDIRDGYFPFGITFHRKDVERLIAFLNRMDEYEPPDEPNPCDGLYLNWTPHDKRRENNGSNTKDEE